VSPARAPGSYP